MANITKLTGSPDELWANKATQENLKAFINKKHAVINPETGKVEAGSSKRSCFSKLIHNYRMEHNPKYVAKKITAAVEKYNKQVAALVAPVLVDTKKIEGQIKDQQKLIADSDAIIAKNVKAKTELLAPAKAAEAKKAILLSALKDVDVSIENVNKINSQNSEIEALDSEDKALEQETARLNTDNSNRYAKYPLFSSWGLKGIKYFNEGNDKEASIKKINEAGYTPNETKALTEDVLKVIDNNLRLEAIPARKKEIADLKKDILAVQTPLIEDVATKIAANATKEGLTRLTDYVSINQEIATLEKDVVDQQAAIAKSADYAACESQIKAASSVKAQAQAEIAKLSAQLGKKADKV